MPAKSRAQQRLMGAVLAAKRGDIPKSALKGPAKQAVRSLTEKQAAEFAATKHRRLPGHVRKK